MFVSVLNSLHSWINLQDQPEAESQEAGPQQVTQSRQVGDGVVVWIQPPAPQPAHHQAAHVQQHHHLENDVSAEPFRLVGDKEKATDLEQSSTQVEGDEGGRHGGVASLQEVDGVQEEEVPRDHEGGQDSGWFGIHVWRKRHVCECRTDVDLLNAGLLSVLVTPLYH